MAIGFVLFCFFLQPNLQLCSVLDFDRNPIPLISPCTRLLSPFFLSPHFADLHANVWCSLSTHGSDTFIAILARLDECIRFLSEHAEYQDAQVYVTRFHHLRNKGLALAHTRITRAIQSSLQVRCIVLHIQASILLIPCQEMTIYC